MRVIAKKACLVIQCFALTFAASAHCLQQAHPFYHNFSSATAEFKVEANSGFSYALKMPTFSDFAFKFRTIH